MLIGSCGKMPIIRIKSNNQDATIKLGQTIGKLLHRGGLLALKGNLGSGKTTFIKGLARGLGIKEKITSPTFVLFKIYNTKKPGVKKLIHADCYRISASELKHTGIMDWLDDPGALIAIEWSEKLKHLPKNTLVIQFKYGRKQFDRIIDIKYIA